MRPESYDLARHVSLWTRYNIIYLPVTYTLLLGDGKLWEDSMYSPILVG